MNNILLPEFHQSWKIDSQSVPVFAADCPYDLIIGRDFLSKIGMAFNFKDMTLKAFGATIAMKPKNFYANPFAALINIMNDDDNNEEEEISNSFAAIHSKTNAESHYEKVGTNICRMNKEPSFSRYYKNNLVYSLETWELSS
jgi:hypothetical protein